MEPVQVSVPLPSTSGPSKQPTQELTDTDPPEEEEYVSFDECSVLLPKNDANTDRNLEKGKGRHFSFNCNERSF